MSKFGPFAIGTRERSRLAWRARVDAAARAKRGFLVLPDDTLQSAWARFDEVDEVLTAALAAPKPWRSTRKPDPRRRYSRSHRRACRWCIVAGYGWRIGQVSGYALKFAPNGDYLCVELRNPHGRRDR